MVPRRYNLIKTIIRSCRAHCPLPVYHDVTCQTFHGFTDFFNRYLDALYLVFRRYILQLLILSQLYTITWYGTDYVMVVHLRWYMEVTSRVLFLKASYASHQIPFCGFPWTGISSSHRLITVYIIFHDAMNSKAKGIRNGWACLGQKQIWLSMQFRYKL